MKFPRMLLAVGAPLMFTACATIAPPQPPSLDLPKPPTDLKASRKGDRVILTWTIPTVTTDRQTIHAVGPTHICRSLVALTQCGIAVGESPAGTVPTSAKSSKQKPTVSYTDTLPAQIESDNSSASAAYAVEVLNHDGRGAGVSNRVQVPLIRTLSPPQDFHAQVTGQGVVLTWTGESAPSQENVRYVYRVYRRGPDQKQQTLVGEVPLGDEHHFTVTDSEIEWQKTYEYRAEIVSIIAEAKKPDVQVEGEDTAEVKVFADDVFPPAVPAGLQAVFSGPGQQPFIDLVWAPVPDVDLAGYNVYRHVEGAAAVKINAELVKAPAYRDVSVEAGQRYLYSVTSVDARGNESAHSEEAAEAVP
jgi:hypothetical protein